MARTLISLGCLVGIFLATVGSTFGAEPGSDSDFHYSYFKERRSLTLDVSRVAVLIDAAGGNRGVLPAVEAEELADRPVDPLALKGWYFAAMRPEKASATGIQAVVSRLAQPGKSSFASPVFVGRDGGPVVVTPKILVGFRPEVSRAQAEAILAEAGAGTILDRDWANMRGAYRMKSAARDGFTVLDIANALARRSEVLYAEPDFIITGRGNMIPNDTLFGDVWGIHNTGQSGGTIDADMDGPEAWDITTGDPSIKVLILDVGVEQTHPDINQLPGADVTSEGPGGGGGPVNVCDNHGTAVAGCVSATINNALGTVGIAPACKSVSVRFAISTLDCSGSWNGQSSWTVDALTFGESVGVRVTNNSNSYGGLASAAIEAKYNQTRDNGMVHFASAHNDGQPVSSYPASLAAVNSIAALERHGNRAAFSNYGPDLFVSAPGEDVLTTDRTGNAGWVAGDYVFAWGTSFASPYTAGVAALVLTINPALPASSVESILASSAVDLGVAGWDTDFGWGFVNAHRAIVTAQGGCNDPGPPDCNNNGQSDACDLFDGISLDCNHNGIPDECESTADCQPNGVADICDIGTGFSRDCNGNTIPDECDLLGLSDDCNTNFIPDECDAAAVASLTNARPAIHGFTDISGTGTPLNLTDDGSATVTIPFAPPSLPSSSARISNNGAIGFGTTADVTNPNLPLPSDSLFSLATAFAVYWDDFDATTGNVYHQTLGVAPNRRFIVQWHNRPRYPGDAVLDGDEGTFQAQIFETPIDGAIAQYLYLDTDFLGAPVNFGRSATVGYQRNSQVAIQYSHNTANSITPAVVLTLLEADCQGNDALDSCEFAGGALDCNGNQVIDECDMTRGQDPDCNTNHIPDSCDLAGGAANCDGDSVPDECELDCQPNGIPDDCDIASDPSLDINGNLIPDVCEIPPSVLAPDEVVKTRFITFLVPGSVTASTLPTGLRVRLISLHHVDPPYTGGTSVPFTAFEYGPSCGETGGCVRWVGLPTQYIESNASPTPFYASSLQCTPHYQDWSTVGLLHVTGSAIVPSSIYEVQNVAASCLGNEASCTAVSAPLSIGTTRWGDVEVPYNPPSTTAQPDVGDIAALVKKFQSGSGAPIKARAMLAGDDALGNITTLNVDLGFGHIAACVDAFRGKPYPFVIAVCP
jgi:subtilisin family serine protease